MTQIPEDTDTGRHRYRKTQIPEDTDTGRHGYRKTRIQESGRDAAVDEAETSREQLLIRAFVGLADTLVDDYAVIDLLDRLVGYCVELLPADAAGILLADPHGALRVVASSNEQTEWIELMQLQ